MAVTGVTGFVGACLAKRLVSDGVDVRGISRELLRDADGLFEVVPVGAIDGSTNWSRAIAGVDTIVHLAARTHSTGGRATSDLDKYRSINVDGTRKLALEASRAGVRRLVFVSSIKVNGERTWGKPFTASDKPHPLDAYGITKWEAEQAIAEVALSSGLEFVVIRPPLVYGPYAKGNFRRLCQIIGRGIPIPLGAVENRRSFVGISNLVDLLKLCIVHPEASGQTFLVSDGIDLSTPELIRRIAHAMETEVRLFPVPRILLKVAGHMVGGNAEVERLINSLQVDIEHTRKILEWQPPVSTDDELKKSLVGV